MLSFLSFYLFLLFSFVVFIIFITSLKNALQWCSFGPDINHYCFIYLQEGIIHRERMACQKSVYMYQHNLQPRYDKTT